jgi:hypothetical protein
MYWTTATGMSGYFLTTLTEVLPCFCISCKANVRVSLAKTGHGRQIPIFSLLLVFMFRAVYSVYYLCVNVYCTDATGCQPNYS